MEEDSASWGPCRILGIPAERTVTQCDALGDRLCDVLVIDSTDSTEGSIENSYLGNYPD